MVILSRILPLLVLTCAVAACEPVVTADSEEACRLTEEGVLPIAIVNRLPIAEVSVNGKPLKMIVDTGATRSVLFDGVAEQVGAQTDWAMTSQGSGVDGAVVHHLMIVDHLGFSGFDAGKTEMGVTRAPLGLHDAAQGLLGTDVMRRYDVSFDIPHHRIVFYHWRNCPNGHPDWSGSYATLTPLPGRPNRGAFVVPGEIGSQPVSVLIDSGSAATLVLTETALRGGVSQSELDSAPRARISGIAAREMAAAIHHFPSLSIGSISIEPLTAAVLDVVSRPADVVLGYALFATHRVWLSSVSDRVYIDAP